MMRYLLLFIAGCCAAQEDTNPPTARGLWRLVVIAALFALVSGSALHAQAATPVLPIAGAASGAALLQVTISATGVGFEAVTQDPGVNVARGSDGKLHASAAVAPVQPPKFKQAGWITLSQTGPDGITKSPDPSVWCYWLVGSPQPAIPDYTVAMLHTQTTSPVSVSDPSAGKFSRDFFTDVANGPSANTNASFGLPVWFGNACGGFPGVVFPPNSLGTGETRDMVQARVTWAQ